MKFIDLAKAFGIASALLVINVLVAIFVVTVYAYLIEPGHPQEFYEKAAMRIAPLCSHIAGTALFFAAGYFFTRRKPEQNGLMFATVVTGFYAIIDAASVGFTGVAEMEFTLSMIAKWIATLVGAFCATRVTIRQPAELEP